MTATVVTPRLHLIGASLFVGNVASSATRYRRHARAGRGTHRAAAASAPITSLAFEPGGRRFVTAGYQDGTVKLWFTSTLQQEGPALRTDPGAAAAIAFAAHGQGLLTVEDRGRAFAWPTALSDWERRACQVAGRNLTRQEWVRLVAEPRYATVCP
ncbi:MAG: hypothetical protein ACXVVK_20590 [Solirubrobacteraceae bacterium]